MNQARPADADLRSFGRKRGRALSERQRALIRDLLPDVRINLDTPPPTAIGRLFAPGVDEVWLEIGFGGAEHLIWQARQNPTIGLIGCEPFEDGVVKALSAIEAHGLKNVLVHPDDARPAVRWLPDKSVARAFILFPDPWPKKRHLKRRLISPALLGDLARVMSSGGELRIATDIADYARSVLSDTRETPDFRWLAESASDWRKRPHDWPATRYEQKAVRDGRTSYFLSFVRI